MCPTLGIPAFLNKGKGREGKGREGKGRGGKGRGGSYVSFPTEGATEGKGATGYNPSHQDPALYIKKIESL